MGFRLTILWMWKIIDPIFYAFSRLHYIKEESLNKSVFRVRITKYKGRNVILSDGTSINKNDLLLKIHLHNVRLLYECKRIKSEIKRARHIYKVVLESMPALANYLKCHPEVEYVKGIIGITTINKGVKPLGFECFEPTNGLYKKVKKLGQYPIFLLSSSCFKDFRNMKLSYLFISKERFFSMYGQKEAKN